MALVWWSMWSSSLLLVGKVDVKQVTGTMPSILVESLSPDSNFASVRASVTQPEPLFATEAVLIETFEPGESVARYMGRTTPYNTAIVAKARAVVV